jgi:hypothetical protein
MPTGCRSAPTRRPKRCVWTNEVIKLSDDMRTRRRRNELIRGGAEAVGSEETFVVPEPQEDAVSPAPCKCGGT